MYEELVKRLIAYSEVHEYHAGILSAAADALEELNKPRWVPVTERLPEEKGKYLTAYNDGYVTENEWTFIGLTAVGWTFDRDAITHWMPLPEPPKEET